MSVLRVILDSKFEWASQVEHSVKKVRCTLQGLRVLKKYFTTPRRIILITPFFYSCLYYELQVWLIPSLKGVLKSKK
jgi:hypothetical protein